MRQLLWILYSPIRLLLIILLSPIISIGYYFLILVVAFPLFIFRKCLQCYCRFRDPSISKVVNSMGHILSRDYSDWHTFPSHTVVVIFKIGGSYTLNHVRDLFLHKWIYRVSPVYRDRLEYPELQQYFTKRCGYLFYKWDNSFHINNHIHMYSDPELVPTPETQVDDNLMIRIWEKMLNTPFPPNRSPWDVHLLPNYVSSTKSPQGIVILRVHHALCDGAAVYKLLLSLTDTGLSKLEEGIAAFNPAPWYFPLALNLKALISGPASVIVKMSKGIDVFNPLHRPLGKKSSQGHLSITSVDVSQIKSICKMNHNVSYHSVLIAALAGGIRNYLMSNKKSIPLSPIRIGLPIPYPGHTYKLRNEYLVSVVDLPVEKKTPKERLFMMEKRLQDLRNESFMPFMSQSWKLLGLFPSKIVKALTLKSAVTLIYSEIKGPAELLTITHNDIICTLDDLMFTFGLGTDDTGLTFNSISYNGKCHIILGMDFGVSKQREKANQLMNHIQKELDCLQFGEATNL